MPAITSAKLIDRWIGRAAQIFDGILKANPERLPLDGCGQLVFPITAKVAARVTAKGGYYGLSIWNETGEHLANIAL